MTIAHGFEVDTHTLLSEKATQASQLNNFLTTVLSFEFPQGIAQVLKDGEFGRVQQLIANVGAVNEDNPDIRSRTHFHDPTKAWAQAGLSWPLGTSQSSILWSQNPNQGSSGRHSWQDARNSYFNALTATDPADRKRFYAETFESLGHLIHLVQDAATPAHTRNDWHLGLTIGNSVFPFLNVDRFHQWAKVPGVGAINTAASQPFDPSILHQTYDGLVPIAGIVDTTTMAGPAAPSAATNIGIAEYSNANFFSDDTILTDYTFPSITQMALSQEPGPDGIEPRSYLRKNYGPGPTGYRAAVSTRLIDFIPLNFSPLQFELDDNVMADYGTLLFPRAIGYSAGLIDYFIRGKMSPDSNYRELYPISNPPTTITFPVVNNTPNEDTGNGTLKLLLRYCCQTNTDESFPPYVISNQVSQNVTRSIQNVSIPFNSNIPVPATIGPMCDPTEAPYCNSAVGYYVLLVYRGPLGAESDSVIATNCGLLVYHHRFLDLSEGVETFINCGGDS
jgi:hypothetical protein